MRLFILDQLHRSWRLEWTQHTYTCNTRRAFTKSKLLSSLGLVHWMEFTNATCQRRQICHSLDVNEVSPLKLTELLTQKFPFHIPRFASKMSVCFGRLKSLNQIRSSFVWKEFHQKKNWRLSFGPNDLVARQGGKSLHQSDPIHIITSIRSLQCRVYTDQADCWQQFSAN